MDIQKVIMTKYLGPTNFRGSRVTAFTSDGQRVTVGYDHSMSREDAHRKAAEALCEKYGWPADKLRCGGVHNGYAFMFID